MIATVTLNPAVDQTLTVPGFAVGRTNRGRIERADPGGKGINVARVARQFGVPVMALGFLAGNHGGSICRELSACGVLADFVPVPGETRVNLKIEDPAGGTETEINLPGFEVDALHLSELERKIRDYAGRSTVMVFSGSLPAGVPPDIYARLLAIARLAGAQTILDTSGPALQQGITAGPDAVKPNRAEAEELLGADLRGEQEVRAAARELLVRGARMALISLGAEGAVAACGQRVWRARVPVSASGSTVGAGDAMVAALAYAMMTGLSFPEALRLATAAGAASASTRGRQIPGLDVIESLVPRVMVEEWGVGTGGE